MIRRLLCTDMDRTLLPNGAHSESTPAQSLFDRLAARREITLAYVTGRHRALVETAILEYQLPLPAFVIADVGTTIYKVSPTGWSMWDDWHDTLAECWPHASVEKLKRELRSLPALSLQEEAKQNRFKISCYAQRDTDERQMMSAVRTRIAECQLDANVIWSLDQQQGIGLLDILPVKANKLTAIVHLMQRQGFQQHDTLFAGDSGNDLDVFQSDIPCVVVANAEPHIKQWASELRRHKLYVAGGKLPSGIISDLNGNYRAGIIEGVCHFWPEATDWLR